MHLAAHNGYAAVVEVLVTQGASVLTKDAQGLRPMHVAAQGKHAAVVELLSMAAFTS